MVQEEVLKLFEYLPSNDRLEEALNEIFAHEGPVTISHRGKNDYTSTHPSEIIRCRLAGGMEREVFLKYEIESHSKIDDHRNNLKYESNVYRQVLSPVGMSTPKYYGSYFFEETHLIMLAIEYFNDLVKFSKSKDEPNIIVKAGRWLGEFQNRSQKIIRDGGAAFMRRYDEEYFMKWPQITLDRIIDLNLEKEYAWLFELVDQYNFHIKALTEAEPVVIHGEFYPTNVRYARRTLYPLDWQTAALSPGEIDIASLTHFWPDKKMLELTLKEYWTVRQLNEPVRKFKKRVLLATMYLNFLWIRYHSDTIVSRSGKGLKFFDNLRELQALL